MAEFYKFFLDLLKFFHGFTGNYGIDIIILTVLVKIILFPLTAKGMKSMKALQSLQPRMKEIQEKYKDDKEKLNKEIFALYREQGINPLGGCLPMLLPIPVFIILFTIFRDSKINGYIFVNSSFLGIDLTTAAINHFSGTRLGDIKLILPFMYDMSIFGFKGLYIYLPALLLVGLMGITTFIQQKSMPSMSGQQTTQMVFMNIFLVYISTLMHSGVLLYWVVSNMLQVVQQKITPTNIVGNTPPETKKNTGNNKEKQIKGNQIKKKKKAKRR